MPRTDNPPGLSALKTKAPRSESEEALKDFPLFKRPDQAVCRAFGGKSYLPVSIGATTLPPERRPAFE